MQQINIDELKPHPRNNEFFDDMAGEKWNEFLESIRTSGVIEPIVVTTDMVIVSGHQRVRACKELGIPEIMCEIKTYKDEDSIIKDLLETNIRQRGDIGGSAKKVGRRIMELERLYGIKNGGSGFYGNQYQKICKPNNEKKYTQSDLSKKLNMSVDTMQNYKTLINMSPELESLVKIGKISKTSALFIVKKIPENEQQDFLKSINLSKKQTKKLLEKEIHEYNLKKIDPASNNLNSLLTKMYDERFSNIKKSIYEIEFLDSTIGEASHIFKPNVLMEYLNILNTLISKADILRKNSVFNNIHDSNSLKINSTENVFYTQISKSESDRLKIARNKRIRELLGELKSDKYKLFSSFYRETMKKEYVQKFNVSRYSDIKRHQFNDALNFIQNFDVPDKMYYVNLLHDMYKNNELKSESLVRSYERYFSIYDV